MATVTIALYERTYWLVTGEPHLDRLLAGDEIPGCAIEFVACATWAEVIELWDYPGGDMPWAIHPKIAQRLRYGLGAGEDDEGWALNLK